MTTKEVRDRYLKFFENRGHTIIPPTPLVLENDPTTLFTSSGMQPLVPYLLGEPHPEGTRVVDSQPSLRVQDIEEVGDNRHTTFFEMLGNWSFGDYFKEEQLPWIWEFLTSKEEGLGLDTNKIYVSVFEGNDEVSRDDESIKIWQEIFGTKNPALPGMEGFRKDTRIYTYPAEKNWWSRAGTPDQMPAGEIGGPDSEMFYDFGEELKLHEKSPWKDEPCHVNCDCGRFMEIGNSVFIQYKKKEDGSLTELPNKNVDFGGGLERLVAATINSPDIFKIDIFSSIIIEIEKVTGTLYADSPIPMRIIADHIRGANALAADGVIPGNKLHGYVMRRLIRRAAIKMKSLKEDFSSEDFRAFAEHEVILTEVNKFQKTLEKGLREFEKLQEIDGKAAFDLYQTYGFPLEITLELAQEKGFEVDVDEFRAAFIRHQDTSRSASAGVFKGGLADKSIEVTRLHTVHHLVLAALQTIIDTSISQKGSNITSERMRMDFNLDRKLTDEEIQKIESLVNEKIDQDLPVIKKVMPKEEAEKIGAQMEFGKKYPDNVSVYFIGTTPEDASSGAPFSVEFCGGPHVERLSEIKGHVRIIKEQAVSAGVRRIYATII